jgi:hypothetical protein
MRDITIAISVLFVFYIRENASLELFVLIARRLVKGVGDYFDADIN